MNGLELWEKVEKTDPSQTKQYQGKGGFKGTAIKPIYLIKKATELWGPMGGRWGVKTVKEDIYDGAPLLASSGLVIGYEKLHSVRILLWYPLGESQGAVESYGHTLMVGSNKYGPFTDDEAPKKSFTDAIGKALHYLGFSADIYFGSFDGSKYDADQKPESAASSKEVPSDLKEKLTKSIQNATQAKAIEEKIAALTPSDTQAAAEILGEIKAMEEPAARERRKKLLSDKVKELGWVVSNANGVISFSGPTGSK